MSEDDLSFKAHIVRATPVRAAGVAAVSLVQARVPENWRQTATMELTSCFANEEADDNVTVIKGIVQRFSMVN